MQYVWWQAALGGVPLCNGGAAEVMDAPCT